MKTCVTTYSFRQYIVEKKCDYFEVIDKAVEMGFEGIEFVDLDDGMWGEHVPTDLVALGKKINEYCKEKGIAVVSYTVGGDLINKEAREEVERLKNCVLVAEALGAGVMRHDVTFALPNEPLYNYKKAIEVSAPLVREISLFAKERGVKTSIENHGYIFQAPERVEELIQAVNCDNYGWMVDIGNFMCADCESASSVAIATPYAFHVHAKDFLFKSGECEQPEGFFVTAGGNYLRGTVLGHGVVPVATCVKRLKAKGYDGYISVEFEGKENVLWAISAGLAYLKKIIEK